MGRKSLGEKIHEGIKALKSSMYTQESKGEHACPGLESCLEKGLRTLLADLWALCKWEVKANAEFK